MLKILKQAYYFLVDIEKNLCKLVVLIYLWLQKIANYFKSEIAQLARNHMATTVVVLHPCPAVGP